VADARGEAEDRTAGVTGTVGPPPRTAGPAVSTIGGDETSAVSGAVGAAGSERVTRTAPSLSALPSTGFLLMSSGSGGCCCFTWGLVQPTSTQPQAPTASQVRSLLMALLPPTRTLRVCTDHPASFHFIGRWDGGSGAILRRRGQ